MFDGIARRYDLMNRLMTFGIDQRWRRRTVGLLQAPAGAQLIDLASGTADMALVAARQVGGCRVIGIDPSAGMLAIGRDKVAAAGLTDRIELLQGDACALPLADRSVDGITMGFGIRNVPDRPQALREMARVLKPGARTCILETSEPSGLLGWGAKVHLRVVVPLLGGLLSGAPAEYRYLQQSTASFPPPAVFAQLMAEAGLEVVQVVPLLAGVAQIYVGTPKT
jgi:demethylmenaquinone methyltransferase/2-methoxy-6-polyprenyl-1,4-benzoquinol methylase